MSQPNYENQLCKLPLYSLYFTTYYTKESFPNEKLSLIEPYIMSGAKKVYDVFQANKNFMSRK